MCVRVFTFSVTEERVENSVRRMGRRESHLLAWFIVQTHAPQSPASQSHSSPDLFLERLCDSL